MDFKGLNKAAVGKGHQKVKLNDLPVNEPLNLTNLKEVETKKLGTQVVASLADRRTFFLPAKIKGYLFDNRSTQRKLTRAAIRGAVSIKPLGASGIEFILKNSEKCKQKEDFSSTFH